LECAGPPCTFHGFLSHSGFRSASDPTSQPHVTVINRSAARYTCYAQPNGPTPPRLFICLGPNVPAPRHGHQPVRGALHLLRSAERSRLRVIDNLSLVPGSQGPGRQRLRHLTGPRHVTPATLSGTVNQTDRFANPVLGVATNPGIIRATARPQDREIAGVPSPAWLFRLEVRVAFRAGS
jgi:hypothetical protein